MIFASTSPTTPIVSTLETKGNQQNTPPKDVLVITISDTSSGSDGDPRPEYEEAPDVVPINSLDSFNTEAHEVITMKDEPMDPGSELEVTSHNVVTGIKGETTTSSTSADAKDLVEGPGRRTWSKE